MEFKFCKEKSLVLAACCMLQPKTPEDNAEKKLRHQESRERKNIQSDFDTDKTQLSMFVLNHEQVIICTIHIHVMLVTFGYFPFIQVRLKDVVV